MTQSSEYSAILERLKGMLPEGKDYYISFFAMSPSMKREIERMEYEYQARNAEEVIEKSLRDGFPYYPEMPIRRDITSCYGLPIVVDETLADSDIVLRQRAQGLSNA